MAITNPMTAAAKQVIDSELPLQISGGIRVSNLLDTLFKSLIALESQITSEDSFQHDAATSSGLSFAFHAATVGDAKGNNTAVAAGTVTLTGSATNYVEYDPSDSTVKKNTSAFTAGRIPLYQVVAGSSSFSIEDITDKRPFMNAIVDDTVEADELATALSDLLNTVSISVGSESGNNIDVSIQVKDVKTAANSVAARRVLEVWLSDTNSGGITATAPSAGASVQTGTAMDVITTDKHFRLITDATGAAVVRVSEVGAVTWYLAVRLQDRIVYSGAITFTT